MHEITIERPAASLDEALALAVTALAEILPPPGARAVVARLPVLLAAAPPSQLLRDFVADLLMLAEREAFCARRLERLQLRDGLRAAVSGEVLAERFAAPRCLDAALLPSPLAWRMRIVLACPD